MKMRRKRMRTKKNTVMKTRIPLRMMLLMQKRMRTTIKIIKFMRSTGDWQTQIQGYCPSHAVHFDQIHISIYTVFNQYNAFFHHHKSTKLVFKCFWCFCVVSSYVVDVSACKRSKLLKTLQFTLKYVVSIMAELLSFQGSIQKLVGKSWKTVGIGQISILESANSSHISLKIVRNRNGDTHIFQCKPKAKRQGTSSMIIKGTDTEKNKDWMLAVRAGAKENGKSVIAQFEKTIKIVANGTRNGTRNGTPNGSPKHRKVPSVPPDSIKSQLTKVW